MFDGLLTDAKTSYDGYTLRINNVETTNIVGAGAPDYTMGFEQIGNMMRSTLALVDDVEISIEVLSHLSPAK